MKRYFLLAAKIIIGVEVFWLVVGNLLLNTPAGPWLASIKQEKFAMDWSSGWTPYPARVSLSDITVRITTWSTETRISADQASATVRILPLLGKKLIIDNLEGGTASVNIQRDKPEGERPSPTKPYPGLTIQFRDATVAAVDELVFNRLKVSGGKTRAVGSASMTIRGDKVIENVEAEWLDAAIAFEDKDFTDTVNLVFSGSMGAFNPRQQTGLEMMSKLTADAKISGHVGTLRPLKVFFAGTPWVKTIDGEGNLNLDLGIVEGNLSAGSKIDIDANRLFAEFLGYEATGSGTVTGTVSEEGDLRLGDFELLFDEFAMKRLNTENTLVSGTGLSLVTRTSDLGDLRQLEDLVVVLDIPNSEYPDITVLDNHLPPTLGVDITSGSATLEGRLEARRSTNDASGYVIIEGNGLSGKFRNTAFSMDMNLESRLSGTRLDDLVISLEGTELRLFNGTFDSEEVEVEDKWWMTFAVPQGEADLSKPFDFSADVEMDMKDTRAIIALFSEINEWIGRFDGFLTVNDVKGSAKLIGAEKSLTVSDLEVEGDRLHLKADVHAEEGKEHALVWGKLGVFKAGLERSDGKNDWKLVNSEEWFGERKEALGW